MNIINENEPPLIIVWLLIGVFAIIWGRSFDGITWTVIILIILVILILYWFWKFLDKK